VADFQYSAKASSEGAKTLMGFHQRPNIFSVTQYDRTCDIASIYASDQCWEKTKIGAEISKLALARHCRRNVYEGIFGYGQCRQSGN
jgi:hypothetical protein